MEEDKITVPSNPIDKVTLEFLMNKTQYKKYVSKTNPTKHIQNEIYLNIYDPYLIDNSMKFSTDLCDYILENEIYSEDILKYLYNFNYKICSY
jgi:hypothetical protein